MAPSNRNSDRVPLLSAELPSTQSEAVEIHTTQTSGSSGHALLDASGGDQPKRKRRLVSLDAVRGLTVAVMILVDELG